MKARYPGICYECGRFILAGELIKRHAITGRMKHLDCKYTRVVLEQQLKEEEPFGFEYG